MVTTRRSYPQTAADLWPNLSPIARTTGTIPHRPFTFGLHAAEDHAYWARLAEALTTKTYERADFAVDLQVWQTIDRRIRGLWDRAIEVAQYEPAQSSWFTSDTNMVDDRANVIVLQCNAVACEHTIVFGNTYNDGRPAAYAVLSGAVEQTCTHCEHRAEMESDEE